MILSNDFFMSSKFPARRSGCSHEHSSWEMGATHCCGLSKVRCQIRSSLNCNSKPSSRRKSSGGLQRQTTVVPVATHGALQGQTNRNGEHLPPQYCMLAARNRLANKCASPSMTYGTDFLSIVLSSYSGRSLPYAVHACLLSQVNFCPAHSGSSRLSTVIHLYPP